MNLFATKRIFLDYASATPVLSEVKKAMEQYESKNFYNPNAIYGEGVKVMEEIKKFKAQIAQMFGAAEENVFFTSGGTEANTWIVGGIKNTHLIIDSESHPSIFDAAKDIKVSEWQRGEEMSIRKDTTLISSVTTDNKIGRQVREIRKKNGSTFPLLHVDASQTAQYFNISLESLACDIITLDAAKLYGPKGIGAIVLRRGVKLDLPPAGTPPVSLIAGFAKALELAHADREREFKRLSFLREGFVKSISDVLPNAEINTNSPNIVNISVPGILPELLVLALDRSGVLVSAGPACNSNKPEPPETPVRISLGKFTTESEVKKAAEIFCREVKNLIK